MPFKSAERAREYNRNYQQRRDARAHHTRVALEERIIHMVREEPGQHDELSLYACLRVEGIPLSAIRRTLKGLFKSAVLRYGVQPGKHSLDSTARLALTNRARELFAPPAGRPDGDRADDHTEGPGEQMKT